MRIEARVPRTRGALKTTADLNSFASHIFPSRLRITDSSIENYTTTRYSAYLPLLFPSKKVDTGLVRHSPPTPNFLHRAKSTPSHEAKSLLFSHPPNK
ncbi:hypothetical protein BDV12DRAFT_27879 [Aspergillus spectabilis]